MKEKQDTPDMTVTSALQVQEAFQRRGIALVFADLITHENYTRYITTLFGHLHRDPPVGYARTSVSQLVAADRTVWQMLLKEGIQPKRDEMGTLSLDSKLMESLQSYRVSFALLPLIAKKDSTPSPLKTTKPAANQGGKGAHLQVQKPGSKPRVARKEERARFEYPIISSNWVARLPIRLERQFVLGSTAAQDALKQRMERNVDGVFIFVRNATVRMVSRSMSRLDSLRSRIMVRALHVIHQNDVWKVRTIFRLKIFQLQLRRMIHAESVLMTATQFNKRPNMTWQRRLTLM